MLRDLVRVEDDLRVRLSVVCCDRCGYLYQNPRFGNEATLFRLAAQLERLNFS